MTLRNIPIRTVYDDPQARFLEFDAYDPAQRIQLHKQKHVNIRTFQGAGVMSPINMLDLDAFSMSALEADEMQDIEGADAFENPVYNRLRTPSESWTAGSQGKLSAHHYWRGLTLTLTTGPNLTQSVDTTHPVDLLTNFDDNDFISIALPSFPDASIDHTQSYIEFTSDVNGTFSGTDRILLSSNINSWAAGNMEFRFARQHVYSSLVGVARDAALASVTGVKINFQATGSATAIVLAIRLLSKDWLYAPLDIDTRLERLELAPSLSGSDPVFAFPTGTTSGIPADFPPMFWADSPSGVTDPRPIDSEFGIAFNVGKASTGTTNRVSLYLREVQLATLTQIDLDTSYEQADLDSYGRQPEYTTPGWVERSRTQVEIDPLNQTDLDDDSQFTLDALPDYHAGSWIEVRLTWDNTDAATIELSDSNGNGYTFPTFVITDQQDYFLASTLEDNSLRVRLYEMDTNPAHPTNSTSGQILRDRRIFDSRLVIDPVWIRRRQGRVGYYAQFSVGDACLYQILPRGLNFAEFRTKPLTSITPVQGAQIFYGGAPDRELFLNWAPGPFGGTFVNDTVKSRSGRSIKIVDDGLVNLQGIQSNAFRIEDIDHTQIEFDINVPRKSGFEAFLYGENGRVVPLRVPILDFDRWQHIQLDLTALENAQTGLYTFVLLQVGAGRITNWYVDNPSILQRSFQFAARGQKNNAWNELSEDWIPFGTHQLNNTQGGAMFTVRERTLQAQARALTQDAYIDNIRVIPVYAQFGNFIWSDQAAPDAASPTVALTVVQTTAAAPIGATDSTIDVASTTNFNSSGKLRIDDEIISYTGIAHSPERFTGCVRGIDGTTGVSHSSGVSVWPDPFNFIATGTSAPGSSITTYEWAFGDSTTGLGSTTTHRYEEPGTYTIGVTVVDSGNRRADTNAMISF